MARKVSKQFSEQDSFSWCKSCFSHLFMSACRAHICLVIYQHKSASCRASESLALVKFSIILSKDTLYLNRQYTNLFVFRNSYYVMNRSLDNLYVEHQRHLSQDMLWKRIPNIKTMSSSIPYRRFVARNMDINGKEAVISAKLHEKLSTNSSTLCRYVLWRLWRRRGTWQRKWEPLRTYPGTRVPDP